MTLVSEKAHKGIRLGILAAYALALEWIAIRAGEPTELWWWLGEIPFFLWMVAPVALPLLIRIRSWLLTAGVSLMAIYSIYVYERAMFGPDARSTSALIFVFLPIYQWVATAILIVVAAMISRKTSP